jgi:putative transposase
MTNHFHLLLRSLEGHISAGMQFLAGRFTRLVNVRVGRDGPLFRGRYASVPIKSDAHLAQVCRYVHLNPVVAGMTPTPEAWRWSSASGYAGIAQPKPWLKTKFVLGLFGPGDAVTAYRDFMSAGNEPATHDFYVKAGW